MRQAKLAAAAAKHGARSGGGDAPFVWCDFDSLVCVIGKIDEDALVGARRDPQRHPNAASGVGASPQCGEGLPECELRGRKRGVKGVALREPVSDDGVVQKERLQRGAAHRQRDVGAAVLAAERGFVGYFGEQFLNLGEMADLLVAHSALILGRDPAIFPGPSP